MQTQRRWLVGDKAWQVEWCAEIPRTKDGDADLDAAKEHRKLFASREDALTYAREVFPRDAFGSVRITPVEKFPYDDAHANSHPYVGFWETTGDTEHFEGEE